MTKPTTSTPQRQDAAAYEIHLQGHLDARWAAALNLAGLDHATGGTTVLHAVVADQSALHGLLQRIRDLGLPLISVTRIPPDEISPASPNQEN